MNLIIAILYDIGLKFLQCNVVVIAGQRKKTIDGLKCVCQAKLYLFAVTLAIKGLKMLDSTGRQL